jgi:hypothetical protein
MAWAGQVVAVGKPRRHGNVRLEPCTLVMAPLHELKAEGAWLFPKLRLVEVYFAFFRVWLRRELQRGKYAKLSSAELDEKVVTVEEEYLDFCRRLAFAMFKRGVTSWTVQHESESAAPVKINLRQQRKAIQAAAKARCCS